MHYFQLISAIPSNLKKTVDLSPTSVSILLIKTPFDLNEAQGFNNNYNYIVPSGIKKWQEKIPEIFVY